MLMISFYSEASTNDPSQKPKSTKKKFFGLNHSATVTDSQLYKYCEK